MTKFEVSDREEAEKEDENKEGAGEDKNVGHLINVFCCSLFMHL